MFAGVGGLTDLVLECTNMPPYRVAVARATGRPVDMERNGPRSL